MFYYVCYMLKPAKELLINTLFFYHNCGFIAVVNILRQILVMLALQTFTIHNRNN
jgi:hypothetical protein